MSIIYDALKKVENSNLQETRNNITVDSKPPRKPNLKLYLVYALVICLGLFAGNLFFGLISRKSKAAQAKLKPSPAVVALNKEQPKPQPLQASQNGTITPAPSEESLKIDPPVSSEKPADVSSETSFILNGVFFSEDQGYALINNQIVKEGDEVQGAIVKKVTLEGVELESAGSSIKLLNREK